MLDMVKDKKQRNREFAMALRQKQIRELKRDPITGEYESEKSWFSSFWFFYKLNLILNLYF